MVYHISQTCFNVTMHDVLCEYSYTSIYTMLHMVTFRMKYATEVTSGTTYRRSGLTTNIYIYEQNDIMMCWCFTLYLSEHIFNCSPQVEIDMLMMITTCLRHLELHNICVKSLSVERYVFILNLNI